MPSEAYAGPTWAALAAAALTMAALTLGGCVSAPLLSNLDPPPSAIREAMAETRRQVRQTTVVRHSRALLVTRGEAAGTPRNDISEQDLRQIERFLQQLGDEIQRHAQRRLRDGMPLTAGRTARPVPIRVRIDTERTLPTAIAEGCDGHPTVWLSLPLLRGYLEGAVTFGVDEALFSDLSDLQQFFDSLDAANDPAPATETEDFFSTGGLLDGGDRMWELWGPQQLLTIAQRADREYLKSLAFTIAHEASHVWFDRCQVVDEQTELRADLFGALSALEAYLYRCFEKQNVLLKAETLEAVVQDVDLRTATADANDFFAALEQWNRREFIGRSGSELLIGIYEGTKLNAGDPHHLPMGERVALTGHLADAMVEAVVEQWFDRWFFRWLNKLSDRTARFGAQVRNGRLCPHIELDESDDWNDW